MGVDLKRRRGPLGRRAQGAARSPTDQPCALSPPRAISAQARVRLNLAAEDGGPNRQRVPHDNSAEGKVRLDLHPGEKAVNGGREGAPKKPDRL